MITPLSPSKLPGRRLVLRVAVMASVLFLLYLAGSALFANKEHPANHGPASPAIPVHAAGAVRGDFPVYFSSLGTVTAYNTVTVRSRVDGELLNNHFTEGAMVKNGDLLAEIDPRPFAAQVKQYQGQLQRDQASLLNARQNLARIRRLRPKDSATQQDLDNAVAQVAEFEAAVIMDQGLLDAAALQLEFTKINAPLNGLAGLSAVDPGNIVQTTDSTGLVIINQVQPINVLFTVTDTQLPQVLEARKAGHPVRVEAWDRVKQTLLATGTLSALDNQVNISTGTVRVKGDFTNADNKLFPNLFVNAKILVDTLKGVCIIPTQAVQLGRQGPFVYVVEADNRVALRQVSLGPADDEHSVATHGVSPGERVVIDGFDRLGDKALVTVIKEK
ncbi:MAG: efflux RND transporter periplasmic adaptor subunit [Desulfovibrionaceae bacterium]|nr:efflux RND transporter periplasmic adaptor subunit [Desulfovibrionaceae bacterium]